MEKHYLNLPEGYDLDNQKVLVHFAAQLDAQLAQLKKAIDGVTVEQLEWQSGPGMNSIGMLLAHNAIVETFWVSVAASGYQPEPEGHEIIHGIIGIRGNDDGLPLPDDGRHPKTLKNKTLEEYLQMLDSAREATHRILKGWTDDDLNSTFVLEEKHEFTRGWMVYHVLEHFISHLGQIRMLKHLMKR